MNFKPRKALNVLWGLIGVNIILYIIGVFFSSEFNPLEWSLFGKIVFILVNLNIITDEDLFKS